MIVPVSMASLLSLGASAPAWQDDWTRLMLVLLLGLVTGAGLTLLGLSVRNARRPTTRRRRFPVLLRPAQRSQCPSLGIPARWLAIKVNNPRLVQAVLGLHKPVACSWQDGLTLAQAQKLFITPCLNGWVLVMGSHLPDPADDVDQCFHLLQRLSRSLGRVQFFSANRLLKRHAWACANQGRIERAYAWAGRTLWNQGRQTPGEAELGLVCYDYGTTPARVHPAHPDPIARNTERVPLLAARWSVDPSAVDPRVLREAHGIVGELSQSTIR